MSRRQKSAVTSSTGECRSTEPLQVRELFVRLQVLPVKHRDLADALHVDRAEPFGEFIQRLAARLPVRAVHAYFDQLVVVNRALGFCHHAFGDTAVANGDYGVQMVGDLSQPAPCGRVEHAGRVLRLSHRAIVMHTMSKSSKRWLDRQRRDPFARRAKAESNVSRAHYKLEDLDRRFKLLKPRMNVLELGAAPGGWTRYVESRVGDGLVVAIDPLPITVPGQVRTIEGCYGDTEVDEQLDQLLSDNQLHLVLSDMAPNISGVRAADQARAMHLADLALDAARRYLRPGGGLVVKIFQGSGVDEWMAEARLCFQKAQLVKPKASRPESREVFAVAQGFRAG